MFGSSGFWTLALLRYAAQFDPFFSLDCAPTPSTLAQSKERKGSKFDIWQPFRYDLIWRKFQMDRKVNLRRAEEGRKVVGEFAPFYSS